MKQALLKMMMTAGAFVPFRFVNRTKPLIVTYHRFSQHEAAAKTSARSFAAQLTYLCAHYTVVPLSQIASSIINGDKLPSPVAAITIDDGYEDAYRIAFPILAKRRLPATVFVVTGFIDGMTWLWPDKVRFLTLNTSVTRVAAAAHGDYLRLELGDRQSRLAAASRVNAALKRLPDTAKEEAINRLADVLELQLPEDPPEEFGPLNWSQVREMNDNRIEIGSHTVTHPILTNITDERLEVELCESKSRIEAEVGKRTGSFCYPNGDCDERVRRATRRAGYDCAVTTSPALNDRNVHPLALRRIDADRDLPHFVQSTSGFEQIKNKLRQVRARMMGHSLTNVRAV